VSRIAVGVLTGIVAIGLLLGAPAAHATNDGPTAIASTVAAGALSGFACWVARKAVSRRKDPVGDFERPGWLVALSGSYAWEQFKDSEEASLQTALAPFSTSLTLDSGRPGVSGFAGYRCHPRFSTEFQIEGFEFSGELFEEVQGRIATVSVAPLVLSVNAKGYLLTGRFQPFALFGVGTMTVEGTTRNTLGPSAVRSSRETMTTLRMGGGIDIYATKRIAVDIKADYVMPVAGNDTFEYYTLAVGLMYRF
jgi:opacity protein-like surface antigen